jgi:hypothetical protein
MATHTFLANGFSMFACPYKQKIPKEEDQLNEHTHNVLCTPPRLTTFVALCLHTTKIDHRLPEHNQDQ